MFSPAHDPLTGCPCFLHLPTGALRRGCPVEFLFGCPLPARVTRRRSERAAARRVWRECQARADAAWRQRLQVHLVWREGEREPSALVQLPCVTDAPAASDRAHAALEAAVALHAEACECEACIATDFSPEDHASVAAEAAAATRAVLALMCRPVDGWQQRLGPTAAELRARARALEEAAEVAEAAADERGTVQQPQPVARPPPAASDRRPRGPVAARCQALRALWFTWRPSWIARFDAHSGAWFYERVRRAFASAAQSTLVGDWLTQARAAGGRSGGAMAPAPLAAYVQSVRRAHCRARVHVVPRDARRRRCEWRGARPLAALSRAFASPLPEPAPPAFAARLPRFARARRRALLLACLAQLCFEARHRDAVLDTDGALSVPVPAPRHGMVLYASERAQAVPSSALRRQVHEESVHVFEVLLADDARLRQSES